MFTLDLDLHLYFEPPMTDAGDGIVLTRKLELPFPPYEGLRVFSKTMDDCPEPMGMTVKDVVWDIDRGVFIADTYVHDHDLPMPSILDSIRRWIGLGWRLGSYGDHYPDPWADAPPEPPPPARSRRKKVTLEEPEHRIPNRAPGRRSAEFNQLFKAMIKLLATSYSNSEVAFAMDKTGRFFSNEQIKERENDPLVVEWKKARAAFEDLSERKEALWRLEVEKYPSIESLFSSQESKSAAPRE